MADPITDLDADIAQAVAYRQLCRRRWSHSPNPDTFRDEEQAHADLDQLLEQRHQIQQRERKD
jgi:hypothetical protein